MPDKMDRFTERARRVLSLAEEEAKKQQQIGTEHLLLGLLREELGIAARVLKDMGITETRIKFIIIRLYRISPPISPANADLSPGVKHTLERAVAEAHLLRQQQIGTEHLLLALIHEPDAMTLELLDWLNITIANIRAATLQLIHNSSAQTKTLSEQPPLPSPKSLGDLLPSHIAGSESDMYVLLRSALNAIFSMIERDQITTEQGKELFQALRPSYLPEYERERLRAAGLWFERLKGRRLQLTITPKNPDESPIDLNFPLEKLPRILDILVQAVTDNLADTLFTDDNAQRRIELKISKDD